MVKRKYNINFFDIVALAVLVLIGSITLISFNNKPSLGDKTVSVEVKITDATMIEGALKKIKTDSNVYFSGTKYPVKLSSYNVSPDNSTLYLIVEGPGNISDDGSTFNGQRIWTHQKVEIRSDYQVQGFVVDFGNEN